MTEDFTVDFFDSIEPYDIYDHIPDEPKPDLRSTVLAELSSVKDKDFKSLVFGFLVRIVPEAKILNVARYFDTGLDFSATLTKLDGLENTTALFRAVKKQGSGALLPIMQNEKAWGVLYRLFEYDDSNSINVEELDELLQGGACSNELFEFLLASEDELAIGILSTLSLKPEQAERLAKPAEKQDISIRQNENGWYLCSDAEPRLVRSMANQSCSLVNGNLLVKFTGKFGGLCLEDFSDETGKTFLAGHWYSPVGDRTRDGIRTAFDNGEFRVDIDKSEWTYMRPAFSTTRARSPVSSRLMRSLLVLRAKKFVKETPDRLPDRIGRQSRADYRVMNYE